MNWMDIERSFNRALYFTFSKKKFLLTFMTLLLCGLLFILCRALSESATAWISLSLIFLPIFLSSGILLALGVVLSRIYYREVQHISVNLKRLFNSSMDLILGISYLSIPPLLIYLLFWIGLGLFFLLREIPGIGEFFSVVLSFAPFLLIFGSLLLCMFNLGLLFFVAPAATLQSMRKGFLAKRVFLLLKNQLFSAIMLFLIAIIPLLFITVLLSCAIRMTHVSFFVYEKSLFIAMQWFFVMIPITAILTPALVFFFNFSSESYALLQRRAPQGA